MITIFDAIIRYHSVTWKRLTVIIAFFKPIFNFLSNKSKNECKAVLISIIIFLSKFDIVQTQHCGRQINLDLLVVFQSKTRKGVGSKLINREIEKCDDNYREGVHFLCGVDFCGIVYFWQHCTLLN